MSEPNDDKQQDQQYNLGDELRELGQQIENAVRNAFESEGAKTVQRDISSGLQEIGKQMQSAIDTIRDDPRVQQLAERGQQALNQAADNPTMQDFQEALARGVSQLNEQLASFMAQVQERSASEQSSAQNVPIDHDDDAPATGETKRLDPEE